MQVWVQGTAEQVRSRLKDSAEQQASRHCVRSGLEGIKGCRCGCRGIAEGGGLQQAAVEG